MNRTTLTFIACGLLSASGTAQDGQFTFGVTWRSAALAKNPSGQPVRMNEADVLTFGPGSPDIGTLSNPALALNGAQLGLTNYANCVGHSPDTPCGIEVDGFSLGKDPHLSSDSGTSFGVPPQDDIWFSTDEFAVGLTSLITPPNVSSEGLLAGDISADVWVVHGLGPGPLPPSAGAGTHVGTFDGNGMPSATPAMRVYPGIGLTEPNTPFAMPPDGDNLDSLNIDGVLGFPASGYYISVDSAFTDPLTGIANSASGLAQIPPVSGADILFVGSPGGTPGIYAPALSLGLDLAGPGTDDVDALVIAENGVGGFQPSRVPYDWNTTGRDMLLFSVRRGSAVIGMPDSIFGVPIEPGDILTTPKPTVLGGLSPFPGILYAAETLGLATARTGVVTYGDDLNALDFTTAPCFDCNNNGVEDAVDISTGGSSDSNGNGIPDECENITEYCQCPSAVAPCSNDNDFAGCANSLTAGAHLFFMGTNKVTSDDLSLVTDGLPLNKFGLYYMGGGTLNAPLGDGVRCVGGRGVGTFRFGIQNSGGGGVFTLGPGIVAGSCSAFPPAGCIASGDTWNFQAWYRDPSGPCGSQFNFSNGFQVTFVP